MKSYNLKIIMHSYENLGDSGSENFLKLESLHSKRKKINYDDRELKAISALVDALEKQCVENSIDSFNLLDGFYYSYTMPYVGHEFDLLKANENKVVNIEVKSQMVDKSKILRQLDRNQWYLLGAGFDVISCYEFVIKNDSEYILYKFNDNKLETSHINNLIKDLKEINVSKGIDLDCKFDPSHFLISPINHPKEFLEHKFFLTHQQEEFENNIIKSVESSDDKEAFIIEGPAGSGKTLLAYDIALKLTNKYKVLIVFGGQLTNQKILCKQINNLIVIPIKELSEYDLHQFDVICIDEAQRIKKEQLQEICSIINNRRKLIVCYDEDQKLSLWEIQHKTLETFNEFKLNQERCKLTGSIRSNKVLQDFITVFLRREGYKRLEPVKVSGHVEIYYASDAQYAKAIAEHLNRVDDFEFISFTCAYYNSEYDLNLFNKIGSLDTHNVIGKEFPKVSLILGPQFQVTKVIDNAKEVKRIQYKKHPYKEWLFERLLYEGMTRAQKSLAIIIYENLDLLEYALSCIKE